MDGINGGVMLLRPCAAAEAHMVALLDAHPKLRFAHLTAKHATAKHATAKHAAGGIGSSLDDGTAEQAFFGWYYRYSGATLPLQWNCQAEQCLQGGRTGGWLWVAWWLGVERHQRLFVVCGI